MYESRVIWRAETWRERITLPNFEILKSSVQVVSEAPIFCFHQQLPDQRFAQQRNNLLCTWPIDDGRVNVSSSRTKGEKSRRAAPSTLASPSHRSSRAREGQPQTLVIGTEGWEKKEITGQRTVATVIAQSTDVSGNSSAAAKYDSEVVGVVWGGGYKKVDKDLNSIFSKCLIVPICTCRWDLDGHRGLHRSGGYMDDWNASVLEWNACLWKLEQRQLRYLYICANK